jgi:hypothetical protein
MIYFNCRREPMGFDPTRTYCRRRTGRLSGRPQGLDCSDYHEYGNSVPDEL